MDTQIEYEKVIYHRGSAEVDVQNLPSNYTELIEQLADIHFNITVFVKEGRVKLEMPSPQALELDGKKEIFSKHLGVDLTSYLVEYRPKCAYCFKYNVVYDIFTLLNMKSIDQRGYSEVKRKIVKGSNRQDSLVKDENGNLVPPQPGKTTPITELPENHVAINYLRSRGFADLNLLQEQFDVSYCYEENPNIYWGRLPHDFKKTAQTRIIFNMIVNGVFTGWQGRLIDYVNEHGVKFVYHPYYLNWFPYSYGDGQIFDHVDPAMHKLSKYQIGVGTARNKTLMGFDCAKKYTDGSIILVEGVLDAAKLGPPAVSVQGKDFSRDQADLILNALNNQGSRLFKNIIVIGDNDESGDRLSEQVRNQFGKHSVLVKHYSLPEKYKDAGDMQQNEAKKFKQNLL